MNEGKRQWHMSSPSEVSKNIVVTRRDLFFSFLFLGLTSFGGVLPWTRRMLVERRGWLTNQEFVDALSLGQILPGPNVLNLSIMVGSRFQGAIGALLAASGLILAPLVIILLLAVLYNHYGHIEMVQRTLNSTASATAGLVLSMGLSLIVRQRRTWHALSITALAFAGAGLLGLPLITVLLVLAPISIIWAWKVSV
jgi:chromate transporter